MKKSEQVRLIQRLMASEAGGEGEIPNTSHLISTDRYSSEHELELEQAALFRRTPVIVAHVSEVSEPGQYVTEEVADVPLIIVRDHKGELRVFINACRHRGAKLLHGESGQCKRLMVCPYHAWSFSLEGKLTGVPDKDVFGDLAFDELNLVPIQFSESQGFVWVVIDGDASQPLDVNDFLGEALTQDMNSFQFDKQFTHKKTSLINECNWKLVMDAFAEGYHVKSLHKDSLSRFFLNASIYDDFSPHVRQTGGRKTLLKEFEKPSEQWDFHLNTTLFYNIFPNTIFVFHPYWVSQMSLFPVGVGRMRVIHRMLVKERPETNDVREKLEASFEHIQAQVFEKEDLAISADIQTNLKSGANKSFVVGGLEQGVRIFHQARDEAIARLKK